MKLSQMFKNATRIENNTFSGSMTADLVTVDPLPEHVKNPAPGVYTITLPAAVWAIVKINGTNRVVAFYHSSGERDQDLRTLIAS